jgi:hypothetical protein
MWLSCRLVFIQHIPAIRTLVEIQVAQQDYFLSGSRGDSARLQCRLVLVPSSRLSPPRFNEIQGSSDHGACSLIFPRLQRWKGTESDDKADLTFYSPPV